MEKENNESSLTFLLCQKFVMIVCLLLSLFKATRGNYGAIKKCIFKSLSHILQVSKIIHFSVDFKGKNKFDLNSLILNSILIELNKDEINRIMHIINLSPMEKL